MTTVDVPTAVHIGADELPFVDIGDGSKLKVIQVKEAEGLWIVENVFQANYVVQRHKHHQAGLRALPEMECGVGQDSPR
jgi:2,4'-dihydroxyacetophenone dioxygenase